MADNLTTFMCRFSRNSGASTSRNPKGLSRPEAGKLCSGKACGCTRTLVPMKYQMRSWARQMSRDVPANAGFMYKKCSPARGHKKGRHIIWNKTFSVIKNFTFNMYSILIAFCWSYNLMSFQLRSTEPHTLENANAWQVPAHCQGVWTVWIILTGTASHVSRSGIGASEQSAPVDSWRKGGRGGGGNLNSGGGPGQSHS